MRKKERAMLREYMDVLFNISKNMMEPEEVSSSICEIHDRLNRTFDRAFLISCIFVAVNFTVGITVFVVNFFRRKS